jgi:hypothetical protein
VFKTGLGHALKPFNSSSFLHAGLWGALELTDIKPLICFSNTFFHHKLCTPKGIDACFVPVTPALD